MRISKASALFLWIFFIITGAVQSTIYREEYYHVQEVKERAEAQQEIFSYILNEKQTLESPLWSEKEKRHMHDVKNILLGIQVLFYSALSIVIGITAYQKKEERRDILRKTGKIIVYGGTIFLLLIIMMFRTTFIALHHILFQNQDWMFDGTKDVIVQLFTEEIFKVLGIVIAVKILVVGCIFWIWMTWLQKHEDNVPHHKHKMQ